MRATLLAALCASAAALAFPAFAQTDLDELTVTARLPDGKAAELSEVVSIADLDLTTNAGQDAMQARVRKVASHLCDKLGETGEGPPLTPTVRSCEDDAVRRSRSQMDVAINAARASTAVAVAAPAPLPDAAPVPPPAPSASEVATPASATFTESTVTNGPVADTPENRARYGQPLSNAGRRTAPRGN